MSNPVLPFLGDTAAKALGGQKHTGVGLEYPSANLSPSTSPTLMDHINSTNKNMWGLLAPLVMGAVVQIATGLTVDAFGADYELAGTRRNFAGGSKTLPANQTNYLWLDATETLLTNTTGFPADVYKLAIVTTDATTVTSIVDARWMNFGIGGTNSWYAVAAAAEVDFNGNGIKNLGSLKLAASTELTIAAGVVTPTGIYHSVDTETDAATDDLATITADAAKVGQLLLVKAETQARVVTMKDGTGNLKLDGDFVLDDADKTIVLMQHTATEWTEVSRSQTDIASLLNSLAALPLTNVSTLQVDSETLSIVESGGFGQLTAFTKPLIKVDTEAMAATDFLDQILGGSAGEIIVLAPANAARIVTVQHAATVGGAFRLSNDSQFEMTSFDSRLTLIHNGTDWVEISRSPARAGALAGSDYAIYQPLVIHLAGVPALGVAKHKILLAHDCRIFTGKAYAVTAPSGGNLIIDILINGLSMFSQQSQMINVADGLNSGSSVPGTSNGFYTAGQTLEIEVEAANAAADVTVVLNAFFQIQQPVTGP